MDTQRLMGLLLVILGLGLGIIAALWVFSNDDLEDSARILGLGLALLVLVAPLTGGGLYLLSTGTKRAQDAAVAQQQRTLLNIVQSRGEVPISDLAVEMQLPRDTIKTMLHQLVGLGVFSGYINWDKGVLYSAQASQLREMKQCRNCGGEINLSGKGVATCRFCGTEYFLS